MSDEGTAKARTAFQLAVALLVADRAGDTETVQLLLDEANLEHGDGVTLCLLTLLDVAYNELAAAHGVTTSKYIEVIGLGMAHMDDEPPAPSP